MADLVLDTILGTTDLAECGTQALRAEELGFDGIWTAEAQHTPFLPLGAAAVPTQRLTLGTGIAVAFARSPMIHAMTAWDLQLASKGRFILGLGTQIKKHNERRFSVEFDRPRARLEDMIRAIRHIWGAFDGEHKLDYHGEFYTHDYIQPFFNPGPCPYGKPRIYIAAVGPEMCRMAGRVCDGILIHPFHTPSYIEQVVKPQVRAGLAEEGRDESDFTYATTAFVITGDEGTSQALAGLVRSQLAFYGSTPNYRPVLDIEGRGELQPQLQQLVREGKLHEAPNLLDDDLVDLFAIRAPFDGLADAIRAKYDGVVGRLGFYLPVVGTPTEAEWAPVVESFRPSAD